MARERLVAGYGLISLSTLVLGLVSCQWSHGRPSPGSALEGGAGGSTASVAAIESLVGHYQGQNPLNGRTCYVWIEVRPYRDERSIVQNKILFAFSGDFGSAAESRPQDLYLEVTSEFAAQWKPRQSLSKVTVDLAGLIDGAGRQIRGPRALTLDLESEGDQLKSLKYEHQKTKPCMWPWKPVTTTEIGTCQGLQRVIHSPLRGPAAYRPPLGSPLLRSPGTPVPDPRPSVGPNPGSGPRPGPGSRPVAVAPRTQGTYYGILGVARDASPEDIRKAYHRLMLQYHPDKIQGSEADKLRMKGIAQKINEAYETLGDPEKRAAYDRQLPAS